ncbi:MAG TPA: ABC transporter permease [Candidatus Aquicultor sp.]|jgi:putative ABC transport system permease protein
MEFFETVATALEALRLNKMRTALATLGIVIGIGAVIALISLGQATQASVQTQIQSLGSNLLTVMPGAQNSGGVRGAMGGGTTLTMEDAKAIEQAATTQNQITTVSKVSPEYSARGQVIAGRNNTNTQIYGVTPIYAEVRKVTMASGRFITQSDVDGMQKVAVLGPTAASNLFDSAESAVGQTLRINGIAFRIVGLTTAKGGSGFSNPDDMIFIPVTTAMKVVAGVNYLSTISIEAKSADVMDQARDQVGYFLLARHKISDPYSADFRIMSQQDILGAVSQVTGTFTTLLAGIAMISLLVGGIGIMNVMLITVIERTREIGLRKSLGARDRDVVTQFLAEAVILTVVGGFLGMMIGIGLSYAISTLMGLPFTVSLSSVVLAIGVSGAIGIIFGFYPAQKAARLSPIEALRFE